MSAPGCPWCQERVCEERDEWLKPHEHRQRRYNGWGVVEQDVLPGLGAPKESAWRNRLYLRGLRLYYDEIIGRPELSGLGRMAEVIGMTEAGWA